MHLLRFVTDHELRAELASRHQARVSAAGAELLVAFCGACRDELSVWEQDSEGHCLKCGQRVLLKTRGALA